MKDFNIKIGKHGVFFEQNGEIARLNDETVDELVNKLVTYVCYRDNKECMIFGDVNKFDLED